MKILDIGTGHGYLAFAMYYLTKDKNIKVNKILGVDCYENNVNKCEEIKNMLISKSKNNN